MLSSFLCQGQMEMWQEASPKRPKALQGSKHPKALQGSKMPTGQASMLSSFLCQGQMEMWRQHKGSQAAAPTQETASSRKEGPKEHENVSQKTAPCEEGGEDCLQGH